MLLYNDEFLFHFRNESMLSKRAVINMELDCAVLSNTLGMYKVPQCSIKYNILLLITTHNIIFHHLSYHLQLGKRVVTNIPLARIWAGYS